MTHMLTCPGRLRPVNDTDGGHYFGVQPDVFDCHLIGHLQICGGPCLHCSLWFSCSLGERDVLASLRSCCQRCLTCRRLIF